MVMMNNKETKNGGNSEKNNDFNNVGNVEEDNNNKFNINIHNNYHNSILNDALLDIISEPNPQNNNNNQNQVVTNTNISNQLVTEIIIDVMNLNPNLLSGFGNNLEGQWAHGENRAGRPYNFPVGWIGYGLNVLNKYDNGNNDWWLVMEGSENGVLHIRELVMDKQVIMLKGI